MIKERFNNQEVIVYTFCTTNKTFTIMPNGIVLYDINLSAKEIAYTGLMDI